MFFGKKENSVIRLLSENSRASVTQIAKAAQCSRAYADKLLEELVRELDIRFTIEVNEALLGFERHIISIKFGKIPEQELLSKLFKDDKYVHNVYKAKGKFDLVIYATAGNPMEYTLWETDLASALSEYEPILRPSEYIIAQFGFMPLNDSFVDAIGKEYRLDDIDKRILKILNNNSRLGYRKIADLLSVDEDTVRYRVHGLKKAGIVKRFTIAIQKVPEEYISMMYFTRYQFSKAINDHFRLLRSHFVNCDKESQTMNSYQLVAPLSGAYRSLGMTIFGNRKDAFKETIKKQRMIFGDEVIEISYADITGVVKGMLPFRNLEFEGNYLYIWR